MALDKVIDSNKLDNDLTAIADSIRAKSGTAESLSFPNGFVSAIDNLETGGDTESIEQMIDESGVLDSTEGTVEEKVEQLVDKTLFFNTLSGISFRENKQIETIDFYLGQPFKMTHEVFYGCSNLKHIVGINTAKSTQSGRMFYNSGIETIDEPFDFSSQPTPSNFSPFDSAHKLVEVRIVPNTYKWTSTISSSVLSDESIQSIIDGLAPVANAQTVRLNTNIVSRLTEEQVIQITNKNWNIG